MLDINRCLIVVKPRQPLLDWAHQHDVQRFTLERVREDATAYLTPEYELLDEEMEILRWCYSSIFEQELFSWYTDESLWPRNRDFETFLEWFDIEFHSLVFDLTPDVPLGHVTYENSETEIDDVLDDELDANGDSGSTTH